MRREVSPMLPLVFIDTTRLLRSRPEETGFVLFHFIVLTTQRLLEEIG